MKKILNYSAILSLLASFAVNAGTINAGFYFDKDCLTKMSYKQLPSKLQFTCNKENKCFANDMTLNSILLCARPFGNEQLSSDDTQIYYLSNKGFKKK